jgi:hypothetical protein
MINAIHGHGHVFGKDSIAPEAEEGSLVAQAVFAALACPAFPTPGCGIRCYSITRFEAIDARAHLLNYPAEFMALG